VSAFTNLASYRGEGTLKSWLSRIVINESLGRMRQSHSSIDLATLEQQQGEAQIIQFPQSTPNDDPERTMAQRQIIHLVEQATDNLPEAFRMVFVTRVIEGMSIEATSELLRINRKPFAEAELLLRNREVVSIPDRTSRTGARKHKAPAASNRSAAHNVARRIAGRRSVAVVLRALLRAAS
jgi:RNA polymerase sigma factor (sigma-70 family)